MSHHQTYIAGVKFRPGANEHLDAMDPEAELTLQPEPTNQYDPNAIKVLDGDFHLGYVPRDLAPEVKSLLDSGRFQRCVRAGGSRMHIHFAASEAA